MFLLLDYLIYFYFFQKNKLIKIQLDHIIFHHYYEIKEVQYIYIFF